MQTRIEEIFNASSHGLGAILSVAALVLMVVFSSLAGNVLSIVSCSIYGTSLIFLYTASTLYHMAVDPSLKKTLKIIDSNCWNLHTFSAGYLTWSLGLVVVRSRLGIGTAWYCL